MRLGLIVLVCAAAMALGCVRADAAGYTLYYLDATHNIRRASLNAKGYVVGGSSAITSKSGYDLFSVSPDGNRFVGFKTLSRKYDKEDTHSYWTTWRMFVEQVGKVAFRHTIGAMDAIMENPTVYWSPKGGYFQVIVGAFDVDVDMYSFSPTKKVVDACDFVAVSSDDRYALGNILNSSDLGVMDLRSGKKTMVSSEGFDPLWVGSTHKIEWVESPPGAYAAEVHSEAGKPVISKPVALKRRSVSYQRPHEVPSGWERTIHLKPHERLFAQEATPSPDGRFIACPVLSRWRTLEIRVFDASGKPRGVVKGRAPKWKGGDVWNPGAGK